MKKFISFIFLTIFFFIGIKTAHALGMVNVTQGTIYNVTADNYIIEIGRVTSPSYGIEMKLYIDNSVFPIFDASSNRLMNFLNSSYRTAGTSDLADHPSNSWIVENGPSRVVLHFENKTSNACVGGAAPSPEKVCFNWTIDYYLYPRRYFVIYGILGNFSGIKTENYGFSSFYFDRASSNVPNNFTYYGSVENLQGILTTSGDLLSVADYVFPVGYNNSYLYLWNNTHTKTVASAGTFSGFSYNNPYFHIVYSGNRTEMRIQSTYHATGPQTFYNSTNVSFGWMNWFGNSGGGGLSLNHTVNAELNKTYVDFHYPASISVIAGSYQNFSKITGTYNFTAAGNGLVRFNLSTGSYNRSLPVFHIEDAVSASSYKDHIWMKNYSKTNPNWQKLANYTDFVIQDGNSSYFGYNYILLLVNKTLGSDYEFWISNDTDPPDTISIIVNSAKMAYNGQIISRQNSDITVYGHVFYSTLENMSYANKQLTFTYDSRPLGSNTTDSSAYYSFTFSIPYEGTYNLAIVANDTYNNTGENDTVLYISTHPLTVKYNLDFILGSVKGNDVYKKASKYVCGYDNTEYSDGLVLGLVHSYGSSDLQDIGFETAGSNGLVGYWKFDEGSGTTAYDSSGYGNSGTLANATGSCGGTGCPSWVDGKFNDALEFDGVGDYITVDDAPILGNMPQLTVGAWIKFDSLPSVTGNGEGLILHKHHNSEPWSSYQLSISNASSNDYLFFKVSNASGGYTSIQSSTILATNTWYHVVGVYNGSHIRMYLNGLVDGGIEQLIGNVLDSDYYLYFSYNWWMQTIDGIIDEIKIWDRSLAADEIYAEYKSEFKLKQNVDNSQLLLTYTKGTCQNIEDRMYLVDNYQIPSRSFSSFSYSIPSDIPILIQFKNDRLQINGSDRFSSGDHKICVENLGKSLGNKPMIGVGKC